MALVCDVCGKKPQFGMRLSHSHRRTKRRWNPNVQKVRAIVNAQASARLHLLPEGRQGAEALTPRLMQGVVRTYDPQTGEGIVVRDSDRAELVLAPGALDGSLFRMLRQGQRVNFAVDGDGRVTRVRIGSEPDMGLPTAQI